MSSCTVPWSEGKSTRERNGCEFRTRAESVRTTRDGGETRETRESGGGGGGDGNRADALQPSQQRRDRGGARTLGANSMTMHSLFGSAMKDS